MDLNDLGKKPKVYDGATGEKSDSPAVVLHASLPQNLVAQIGIVNLFTQGDGDTIRFDKGKGFEAAQCTINGEAANLAEYLTITISIQNFLRLQIFMVQCSKFPGCS